MVGRDHQIEEVYAREGAPLRAALLRSAGGNRQLAEDIAQESWLRAVLWWPSHGVPDRPGAWLRTVSRNLLFNERRRRVAVPLDGVPPEFLATANSTTQHPASEQSAALHEVLAELPPESRQLIESFYFEGRPIAEIARGLALSDRGVEGRLRRVRIRLRAALEARGISEIELRGTAPVLDLSLFTLGKVVLMSAILPWLAILAGYFIARRLYSTRSDRGRSLGYVLGGLGLMVLGALEAPEARALQWFGASVLLFGAWRLWRRVPLDSSV
jgi:RNA polymerase sigma-70 factor (ECF subfamily)